MGRGTSKTPTAFGVLVRNIRTRYKETGQEMAKNLGITKSFMSAIELGDRGIPKYLIEKLLEVYKLTKIEEEALDSIYKDTISYVLLKLDTCSIKAKICACKFAEELKNLNDCQINTIYSTLLILINQNEDS